MKSFIPYSLRVMSPYGFFAEYFSSFSTLFSPICAAKSRPGSIFLTASATAFFVFSTIRSINAPSTLGKGCECVISLDIFSKNFFPVTLHMPMVSIELWAWVEKILIYPTLFVRQNESSSLRMRLTTVFVSPIQSTAQNTSAALCSPSLMAIALTFISSSTPRTLRGGTDRLPPI